jgi:CBS domain-containing protein
MKISDIMTRRPITVGPAATMGEVVKTLADNQISGLLVVNRNKLVGVITQTDVIKAVNVYDRINRDENVFALVIAVLESKDEKIKAGIKRMMKKKVREFMKTDVVSISHDEDLSRAASLINMHEIDRLPVLNKGKLVGVITKSDIIMALEKLEN